MWINVIDIIEPTKIDPVTPQFHGSVLQPDLLTFLLTFLRPEINFKNISPHGEIVLI